MKPKFIRMIDGVPAMTVTEHEAIVGQLVTIIEGLIEGAEPDCGDPGCKDCDVWRPAWAAIDALGKRDWSLLEATQESLREHMAEIQRLQQRPWIGLTAKDLAEIPPSAYEGAIWAEAKLKEKNT